MSQHSNDSEPVSEPAVSAAAGPTFADLGIDDRVLQALTDVGNETPSPIQAETIPLLLAGRDVVGLAQTGTGKTAALAVPEIGRVDIDQRLQQALVQATSCAMTIHA